MKIVPPKDINLNGSGKFNRESVLKDWVKTLALIIVSTIGAPETRFL